MIDLDETLRHSLAALADARPVTVPPIVSIMETAIGSTAFERPAPAWWRRRRLVFAVVAGGVTLTLGGAALGGVLPGAVTDGFNRMSGWGGPCRIATNDARLLASTTTPDGSTLEWWGASTATPNQVDGYTRLVRPDGRSVDQSMSCAPQIAATTKIAFDGGATSPSEYDVWGEAPELTATLTATLSDGSTANLPLQNGRNFVGAFVAGRRIPKPVSLTARAADGSVIDELRLPRS